MQDFQNFFSHLFPFLPNRRSISLNYTEKEIQEWREERRKNYPSKSNIQKVLFPGKFCVALTFIIRGMFIKMNFIAAEVDGKAYEARGQ